MAKHLHRGEGSPERRSYLEGSGSEPIPKEYWEKGPYQETRYGRDLAMPRVDNFKRKRARKKS